MSSEHHLPPFGDRTPPGYKEAEVAPRERRLVNDLPSARAARMIFLRWLALRHRGVDLGPPVSDPVPGPYGSWYRVYRNGRIFWHPDVQFDVRLGVFGRAPVQSARVQVGSP